MAQGGMEGGLVELCLGRWDRRAERMGEDLGGRRGKTLGMFRQGKGKSLTDVNIS